MKHTSKQIYFKPAIKCRCNKNKWQCISIVEFLIIYLTRFLCRSDKEWLRIIGFDGIVETFVNTSWNLNLEFTMDCKVIYGFDLSLSKMFHCFDFCIVG